MTASIIPFSAPTRQPAYTVNVYEDGRFEVSINGVVVLDVISITLRPDPDGKDVLLCTDAQISAEAAYAFARTQTSTAFARG